jgi:hypothetical protein
LVGRTEFKHFLHNIVAEDVFHQFVRVGLACREASAAYDLLEKTLLFLLIGFFKALLHKTGTLLVQRALNIMTQDFKESQIPKALRLGKPHFEFLNKWRT